MTNFLNLQTGLLEPLGPGDAEEAYLKGTHGIDQKGPAYVVDPRDSMTYEIPATEAPEYIKTGFRFEQPDEKSNRLFREDVQDHPIEYGLKTFGYQAANQAALGAISTGVELTSPEKTARRDILQEENPMMNFLGGATGLGLSAMYGGPIWDGVGFAGQAGAQMVRKGVQVFGKDAAQSLAGRAAMAVARGAGEGAAVMAPTAFVESALGDHNGVAEAMMAGAHRLEEGALFGAAFTPLASALKFAGKQLSPEELNAASREFQLKGMGGFRTPEIKRLEGVVQPEINELRAAATTPDEAAKYIKPTRGIVNEEVGKLFDQQGFNRDLGGIFKNPQDLSDKLKESMIDIGQKMNFVRDEADLLIPNAVTPGNFFTAKMNNLSSKYDNTLGKEMTTSAQDIENVQNAIREKFALGAQSTGSLGMGFNDAFQLQQELKSAVFPTGGFGRDAAKSPGAFDAYTAWTEHMDSYLNQITKSNPQVFDVPMGELKKAYGQSLRLASVVDPAAARKAANNHIGLTDYISGGIGAGIGHSTLGAIAGAAGGKLIRQYGNQLTSSLLWKASQAIDHVQDVVNKTIGAANVGRLARNIVPGSVGVMAHLASDNGEPVKDRNEAFQKVSQKIMALGNNPEKASDVLNLVTSGLQKQMPATQQAMQQNMVSAVAYLQGAMPQAPASQDPFTGRQWQPSDRELASFERKLAAVNDPLSILQDMKNGILTKEAVDAVQTVYPMLFQHIQQRVMESAGSNPELPYSVKAKMSLILGIPLRGVATPAKIKGFQQAFVTTGKPKPRANSKITESARTGTELDRVTSGQ